jgi:DNA-binding MarR family transcriptional regulator
MPPPLELEGFALRALSLYVRMIFAIREYLRGRVANKPEVLKPQDIAVALRLAVEPEASYATLGADLSMSPSTAHESVGRLQLAGLLRPESRQVNRYSLLEYLEHGLRYTFPAKAGSRARGVPTAYSSPAMANEIVADDVIVWPDPRGSVTGQSIPPLLERAAELPAKCPPVYELLTLVDAIRVGRVRERAMAVEKIKERLAAAV